MGLLDNTYWLIDEDADVMEIPTTTFVVDFRSNGEEFHAIKRNDDSISYLLSNNEVRVSQRVVYDLTENEWTDEAYRRIHIHSAVDDEDLAAWLTNNATQFTLDKECAVTCSLGDDPVYSQITFFQHDFGSGVFTITINGIGDVGFLDGDIFISYRINLPNGFIYESEEYPCEVVYGETTDKVKTVVPDDVLKRAGKWAAQLHIYSGDTRRSTNIFTFGVKPDVSERCKK